MRGAFQLANAGLAAAALDSVDELNVPDDAVIRGLSSAFAPGRLEMVRHRAPCVVVDVAHNEMAAHALGEAIMDELYAAQRPLVLVVGMSRNHAPEDFLSALAAIKMPVAVVATEPSFRPGPAEDVAVAARRAGVTRVEIVRPVAQAARRAVAIAAAYPDPLVLATGSFYTVGDLGPDVWEQILTKDLALL
jgi:dihydrofolate synthase/folylpolyglutamate synthase